jgi:hypothetical protein
MCHTDDMMKAQAERDAAIVARYEGLVRLENDFNAVVNGTPVMRHELETLVDRAENFGVIARNSAAGTGLLAGGNAVALHEMTRSALMRLRQEPAVQEFIKAQP